MLTISYALARPCQEFALKLNINVNHFVCFSETVYELVILEHIISLYNDMFNP